MNPAAPSPVATEVGGRPLESIRAEFPILSRQVNGATLSYLDNGATVQKPAAVIEAVDAFYREHYSNVHRGAHALSAEATALYEGARTRVAAMLGADRREIVFTRNVTAAINLAAQAWGADNLGPGDRIVLTEMEHHSNIVPWHLVAQTDRSGTRLGRHRRRRKARSRGDVRRDRPRTEGGHGHPRLERARHGPAGG